MGTDDPSGDDPADRDEPPTPGERRRAERTARAERRRREEFSESRESPGSDGESPVVDGLIALLLVVGLALLVFPEPATSTVGAVLVAAGTVLWLLDALT